jgi:hypothetical protein
VLGHDISPDSIELTFAIPGSAQAHDITVGLSIGPGLQYNKSHKISDHTSFQTIVPARMMECDAARLALEIAILRSAEWNARTRLATGCGGGARRST